jgi:hypothetical protein
MENISGRPADKNLIIESEYRNFKIEIYATGALPGCLTHFGMLGKRSNRFNCHILFPDGAIPVLFDHSVLGALSNSVRRSRRWWLGSEQLDHRVKTQSNLCLRPLPTPVSFWDFAPFLRPGRQLRVHQPPATELELEIIEIGARTNQIMKAIYHQQKVTRKTTRTRAGGRSLVGERGRRRGRGSGSAGPGAEAGRAEGQPEAEMKLPNKSPLSLLLTLPPPNPSICPPCQGQPSPALSRLG